jgi:hypothetical protein
MCVRVCGACVEGGLCDVCVCVCYVYVHACVHVCVCMSVCVRGKGG